MTTKPIKSQNGLNRTPDNYFDKALEILDYEPLTGLFTYRADSHKFKAGDVAGSNNGTGYRNFGVTVEGKSKNVLLHRVAFYWKYGRQPLAGLTVNHINDDRADNRIENLEEATVRKQNIDRPKQKNCSSEWRFVTWHKAAQKWQAQLQVAGKRQYLGLFDDEFDAAWVGHSFAASAYKADYRNDMMLKYFEAQSDDWVEEHLYSWFWDDADFDVNEAFTPTGGG